MDDFRLIKCSSRFNHVTLEDSIFSLIPVKIEEIPVYSEFLVEDRDLWVEKLALENIETRPFYPSINFADYLLQGEDDYKNSNKFSNNGIYLPSGPSQSLKNIEYCINSIKRI